MPVSSVLSMLIRPPPVLIPHIDSIQLSVCLWASRKYPIMSVCTLLYHCAQHLSRILLLCQRDEWWQRSESCLLLCARAYCASLCLPDWVGSLFVAPRQRCAERVGSRVQGRPRSCVFHTTWREYRRAPNDRPGHSLSLMIKCIMSWLCSSCQCRVHFTRHFCLCSLPTDDSAIITDMFF